MIRGEEMAALSMKLRVSSNLPFDATRLGGKKKKKSGDKSRALEKLARWRGCYGAPQGSACGAGAPILK